MFEMLKKLFYGFGAIFYLLWDPIDSILTFLFAPGTFKRHGMEYIGQHFILEKPTINHKGELFIDGKVYKVYADSDISAGAKIVVQAVHEGCLHIDVY